MGGHHPFAKDPWQCSKNTTLPGCNSCKTASEHSGCYDAACAKRVCDNLGELKCCEESWDQHCAVSAELVCIAEITPMISSLDDENEDGYCPMGYVCDASSNLMTACSNLRQGLIDVHVGDILGGIFCPDDRSGVLNCPPGYFCPTSTEKVLCPAGMFCPTKTIRPWISCPSCGVGATEIPKRDLQFGCYVIMFIMMLLPLASWTFQYMKMFCNGQTSFARHEFGAFGSKLGDFGAAPRSRTSTNKENSTDDEESQSSSRVFFEGIDISFRNLCLGVQVETDKTIDVVNNLTGCIRPKTMTALIGASGAGKTSLLNALCGRAYYGEVRGDIFVNGHPLELETIKGVVGFVQQDDIISHTELTVRENLIYSGRFRLPKGTTGKEIEQLADSIMSSLGLAKVANQIVGDVHRRGVSGGEKKRVCVDMELMGRPVCLFLDEPTSGLDASSALMVMQSLRRLVDNQGVTIVSSIHQPRKIIFDMFDSLVVLGVGGRMVYHGPNRNVINYMESIGYRPPPGESIADFLIDISSGQLPLHSEIHSGNDNHKNGETNVPTAAMPFCSYEARGEGERNSTLQSESSNPCQNFIDEDLEARRRKRLCELWIQHCENLDEKQLQMMYNPPIPSKLPVIPIKQPFRTQLAHQITRGLLICWRNRSAMLLDFGVMLGANIVIAVTCGTPQPWVSVNGPNIVLSEIADPSKDTIQYFIRQLFKHANTLDETPVKFGVFLSVMTCLQVTKIITNKRLNFFAEASSGYNISAYLVATDLVATAVFSLQLLVVAFWTAYVRQPLASWESYYIHFLVLGWVCVSWALIVPMVVPKDNVSVVIGCSMCISGLLLSGTVHPLMFPDIYDSWWAERVAGWTSPTRFFVEALTVGEYRCMPPQSGYTVEDESIVFDRKWTLMYAKGLARHDPNATQMDCGGWYWSVWPCLMVGLTLRFISLLSIHGCNRAQQTKKPLVVEMRRSKPFALAVLAALGILVLLIWFTTSLFTRDLEANYEVLDDVGDLLRIGADYTIKKISTLSGRASP